MKSFWRTTIFVIFFYASISCQTTDDALKTLATESDNGAINDSDSLHTPIPSSECPPRIEICTKEFLKVLCRASIYAGQKLNSDERLVAWGANPCVGMFNLKKAACENNMQPGLLDQIDCVPDASNGNCPIQEKECLPIIKPVICVAQNYGTYRLTETQKITAKGDNECKAREKLFQLACRSNLDPLNLKKIFCELQTKKS